MILLIILKKFKWKRIYICDDKREIMVKEDLFFNELNVTYFFNLYISNTILLIIFIDFNNY
jgi:hypothetical protein